MATSIASVKSDQKQDNRDMERQMANNEPTANRDSKDSYNDSRFVNEGDSLYISRDNLGKLSTRLRYSSVQRNGDLRDDEGTCVLLQSRNHSLAHLYTHLH